jgi:hypothetical protein
MGMPLSPDKEVKEAESQGFVDSNADAVAYAESLKA